MQEQDQKLFVDSIANFFERSVDRPARIEKPYIKDDDEKVLLEYSGLIGISGHHKGCIYFTAERAMLLDYTRLLLGDDVGSEEAAVRDMVGEIANNICGNVSETFGRDFMISVPAVITGDPSTTSIKMEVPTHVFAFEWEGHRAYLVVGINENA